MIYFLVNHATTIGNIIAIIAMIIAAYEIRKALREIDKLSASRLSRSSDSLTDSQREAKP